MNRIMLGLMALSSVLSYASDSLPEMYRQASSIRLVDLNTYEVTVYDDLKEKEVKWHGANWECSTIGKIQTPIGPKRGNRWSGRVFNSNYIFSQNGKTVKGHESSGYDTRQVTFRKLNEKLIVEITSDFEGSHNPNPAIENPTRWADGYDICSPTARP